jgi:hypothetical protein
MGLGMSKATLFRCGGLAAIAAGVLRAGAAVVPASGPSVGLEWFYLTIDVLILFALIAIYAYQHVESGIWGFVGFVITLAGTEAIGGPDGMLGGVDIYRAGASVIGIGLVIFAIGTWQARRLPPSVPVLWIASTVIGMTTFLVASTVPFVIAGIAFGLGFVGAGVRLWTDPV